jgi:hypothetical protein
MYTKANVPFCCAITVQLGLKTKPDKPARYKLSSPTWDSKKFIAVMAIRRPASAQHRFKTEYWTRSKTPLNNSAPNNIKKFVPEQLMFAHLVKNFLHL